MKTVLVPEVPLIMKRDCFSGSWFRITPKPIKVFSDEKAKKIVDGFKKRGVKVIIREDEEQKKLIELRKNGRLVLT